MALRLHKNKNLSSRAREGPACLGPRTPAFDVQASARETRDDPLVARARPDSYRKEPDSIRGADAQELGATTAVLQVIDLIFNDGYSAAGAEAAPPQRAVT
jgi:predicted RNA polymerase sigma factor